MTALIAFYWYGLLITFGIGLLTGWASWGQRPDPTAAGLDPSGDDAEPLETAAPPPPADPRLSDINPPETDGMPEAGAEAEDIGGETATVPAPANDVDLAEDGAPREPFEPPIDVLGPAIAAALPSEEAPSAEAADAVEQEPVAAAPEPVVEPSQAADDLVMIKGIGPRLARLLNSLGVHRFDDIASWKPEDIELIDSHLGEYRGRIIRDEWIQQARLLAKGDIETFNQRYGHLPY